MSNDINKQNIRDLSFKETEELAAELGEPKFRAKQLYKWMSDDIHSFDEMTNIPKAFRTKLEEKFYICGIKIEKKFVSRLDGTRRYLLKLRDGNFIESVLMKYHHGYSICISSEVGCAMGCKFCASTKNGKKRVLTAGEIEDQVIVVQGDLGERISNIVMMGVGEPLDNFENTIKFIENINDPLGVGIGQRHIAVSTCGIVENIYRLADMKLQITLAISLHASDDEARSAIMPINKKYGIKKILDACKYYTKTTSRRITFEYTLIGGVNDAAENAEDLARILRGQLCHVNLIPVNKVEGIGFRSSGTVGINRFAEILNSRGIPTTVRREMGSDISAACGQLRGEYDR